MTPLANSEKTYGLTEGPYGGQGSNKLKSYKCLLNLNINENNIVISTFLQL